MASIVRRALPVLLAAVALVGCGAGDPVSKTYGTISDADRAAARRYSESIQAAATAYARALKADTDQDLEGLGREVDTMRRKVADAQDIAVEFDNGKLRDTFEQYAAGMQRLAGTLERYAMFAEQGTGDPAAQDAILADLQDAAQATRREDEKVFNAFVDAASPEDRAALRKSYRDAQRAFEQTSGTGP